MLLHKTTYEHKRREIKQIEPIISSNQAKTGGRSTLDQNGEQIKSKVLSNNGTSQLAKNDNESVSKFIFPSKSIRSQSNDSNPSKN